MSKWIKKENDEKSEYKWLVEEIKKWKEEQDKFHKEIKEMVAEILNNIKVYDDMPVLPEEEEEGWIETTTLTDKERVFVELGTGRKKTKPFTNREDE